MARRLLVLGAAVVVAVVVALLLSAHDDSAPESAASKTADVRAQAAAPPVDAGWSERGMNVTSYQPEVFASPAAGVQLDRIAATGATTAVIVVTWYQDGKTSAQIAPDAAKSATDDGVRALAAQAQARGMTVALKPQVDVLDGTFRGQIAPSDPAAWQRSYDAFATHEADLANQIGARVFVVGTELSSTIGRTDDWRALIGQVRGAYHGLLTYAANWTAEAEKVQFWDALDAIGIDAYMPLVTRDPNPNIATLVAGWSPWRQKLEALHRQWNKPVLFTELGYPSRLGAAQHPSVEGSGAVSYEAQRRAYEAAFRAWKGVPWFRGVWWWDWLADGAAPAGSYPPAGKTAEQTLVRWLATAPAAAPPTATSTATTAAPPTAPSTATATTPATTTAPTATTP